MVKKGPEPLKTREIKQEIMGLLMNNPKELGFNEINLALKLLLQPDKQPGSYGTLSKCLKELVSEGYIIQDPASKKYRETETLPYELNRSKILQIIDSANVIGGDSLGGGTYLSKDDSIIVDSIFKETKDIPPDLFESGKLDRLDIREKLDEINRIVRLTQIKDFNSKKWHEAYLFGIYMNVDFKKLGLKITKGYIYSWFNEHLIKILPTGIEKNETVEEPTTGVPAPHTFGIVTKQLNTKFLLTFIKEIIEDAIKEKMIINSNELNLESFKQILDTTFSGINNIVFTHAINTNELLTWLNTEEGKDISKKILDNVQRNLN